jgi:hypothetical protein
VSCPNGVQRARSSYREHKGQLSRSNISKAPSLKIDNSPKLTAWRFVGNGSIRGARYVGRIICAHAEKDIDFVGMNKRLGFFAHGLEHFDDLGGPIWLLDKISDAGPIHLGFRFRINIATADNNL